MRAYAIAFLIIATIAGIFGFGGIGDASTGVAQLLFFVFLTLFVATVIMRVLADRS